MAERSEYVITWNIPNVISVWIMVTLLWVVLGIGSHMFFRRNNKGGVSASVKTDDSGNFEAAAG